MIEKYNVRELLTGYTLFVPEIQRDYVWGSVANCNNVMIPFIKTLNHNLKDDISYNIGFLYSYTNSKEDNYIIDGQQRFTTIILLLYVLAIEEGKDFASFIGVKSPTMHFSYNVRPQTENFMRHLFCSGKVKKTDILNQTWFFPEYESDITIMSMVNAVDNISSLISKLSNLTYEKVLDKVCFWYFNVEETSQGEELYITMNSRGQKLTDSEQIKPYLFNLWNKQNDSYNSSPDYGKLWDDWEEGFYQEAKRISETNNTSVNIKSVDIAMNSFLKIVYEMETEKECYGEIPFRDNSLTLPMISRYKTAMDNFAQGEWPKLLSSDNKYEAHTLLKALIAEGLKPSHKENDTKRIHHVISNIIQRNYVKNRNDILRFLHKYSESSEPFYDFIIGYSEKEKVFDEHEMDKIRIYKSFEFDPKLQETIESAFTEEEAQSVWKGNISPLICWSIPDKGSIDNFDFEKFKIYAEKFNKLFGDDIIEIDKKAESSDYMDLTRRALLAFGFYNYPRKFEGNTNISFGKTPEHWHKLFLDQENIPKLKEFLDKYDENSLQAIFNEYPEDKAYSDFVHMPDLMKFCKNKNIQIWFNNCIYLIESKTANGSYANIHSYKYYLKRKKYTIEGWSELKFWAKDSSCSFLEQANGKEKHIAIDVYWNGGNQRRQMVIEIHLRESDTAEIETYLSPLKNNKGYQWNGSRYVNMFDTPENENEAFELMDRKLLEVINFINESKL